MTANAPIRNEKPSVSLFLNLFFVAIFVWMGNAFYHSWYSAEIGAKPNTLNWVRIDMPIWPNYYLAHKWDYEGHALPKSHWYIERIYGIEWQ